MTSRMAISLILPERVRGMSGTCAITAGTWRGGGVAADLLPDAFAQGVLRSEALAQAHEQQHALVVVDVLADGDGFQDFGDLLDLG